MYLVNEFQKNASFRKSYDITNIIDQTNGKEIEWIEKLLHIPLADFRKYCLWRIMSILDKYKENVAGKIFPHIS